MLETNSEMSPQFMQLAVVLPDHTLVREERCAVGVAVVRATNAQKGAIVRGRAAVAAEVVHLVHGAPAFLPVPVFNPTVFLATTTETTRSENRASTAD